MAWVNKKYECSECERLFDDFDEAKECCDDFDWRQHF